MLGGAGEVHVVEVEGGGPQSRDPLEDLVEVPCRIGADAQARTRRIGLAFADADVEDLEGAIEIHDLIQHLRQDERVDDVSADVNGFRWHLDSSIPLACGQDRGREMAGGHNVQTS